LFSSGFSESGGSDKENKVYGKRKKKEIGLANPKLTITSTREARKSKAVVNDDDLFMLSEDSKRFGAVF